MAVDVPRVLVESVIEQIAIGVVADQRRQGRVVPIVGVVARGTSPADAAGLRDIAVLVVAERLTPR